MLRTLFLPPFFLQQNPAQSFELVRRLISAKWFLSSWPTLPTLVVSYALWSPAALLYLSTCSMRGPLTTHADHNHECGGLLLLPFCCRHACKSLSVLSYTPLPACQLEGPGVVHHVVDQEAEHQSGCKYIIHVAFNVVISADRTSLSTGLSAKTLQNFKVVGDFRAQVLE